MQVLLFFSFRYVIPVFVWVGSFAIVFAQQLVQPVVSVLTFFKGSLLLGTVSCFLYLECDLFLCSFQKEFYSYHPSN